jgi:hypothetical protein
MSRNVCVVLFVAGLVAFSVSGPVAAVAAGDWVRPVDGEVVLAYGSPWSDAGGRVCTHGGLDLGASAGTAVRACGPGEVVFAGLVPAGEGTRAFAVTVLTPDGLRVTYLPLSSVRVSRGQALSAGGAIGSLAGSGDASSAGPHLHLGVKRGSASLDPAAFLAAPAAPASPVAPRPPGQLAPSPAHAYASGSVGLAGSAARVSAVPNAAAAVTLAARAAAEALAEVPPTVRVEPVAAPAVLDLDRAAADVASGRASALPVVVRIGLLLIAGACVAPVIRRARAGVGRMAPVPVPRDRG